MAQVTRTHAGTHEKWWVEHVITANPMRIRKNRSYFSVGVETQIQFCQALLKTKPFNIVTILSIIIVPLILVVMIFNS